MADHGGERAIAGPRDAAHLCRQPKPPPRCSARRYVARPRALRGRAPRRPRAVPSADESPALDRRGAPRERRPRARPRRRGRLAGLEPGPVAALVPAPLARAGARAVGSSRRLLHLARRLRDPRTDLGLDYETVELPAVDGSTLRGWFVPGEPGRRRGSWPCTAAASTGASSCARSPPCTGPATRSSSSTAASRGSATARRAASRSGSRERGRRRSGGLGEADPRARARRADRHVAGSRERHRRRRRRSLDRRRDRRELLHQHPRPGPRTSAASRT